MINWDIILDGIWWWIKIRFFVGKYSVLVEVIYWKIKNVLLFGVINFKIVIFFSIWKFWL